MRSRLGVASAVLIGWALLIYLIPLGVGYAVGARPLRLMSSGFLFDQVNVTFAGYRLLTWSPVVSGALFMVLGLTLKPSRATLALGIVGATFAATLLTLGGVLGIGPGSLLLLGTELRWVWKICLTAGGLAVGLVGPMLLKTHAEDHNFDFRAMRRDILLTGAIVGVLILLVAPGPLFGKVMTGVGSWLGSLVWVVGL